MPPWSCGFNFWNKLSPLVKGIDMPGRGTTLGQHQVGWKRNRACGRGKTFSQGHFHTPKCLIPARSVVTFPAVSTTLPTGADQNLYRAKLGLESSNSCVINPCGRNVTFWLKRSARGRESSAMKLDLSKSHRFGGPAAWHEAMTPTGAAAAASSGNDCDR